MYSVVIKKATMEEEVLFVDVDKTSVFQWATNYYPLHKQLIASGYLKPFTMVVIKQDDEILERWGAY